MTQHTLLQDDWKRLAAEAAARLLKDDMFIGLGTGSTANCFIQALALRARAGLRVAGTISSSTASQQLAASLDLPITDLASHPALDLYVDGADEVDPQLQLLKGAGGALLREKVIATAAHSFVVIADSTKKVQHLGEHFPVPVETAPFALPTVRRQLAALGASVQLRETAGSTFVTENHNFILDCRFANAIANPRQLDAQIHSIVGVVETGLFLDLARQVIIAGPHGVEILP